MKMKKPIYFLALVLAMCLASVASAAYTVYWRGDGDPLAEPPWNYDPSVDVYWSNADNWITWPQPDYYPTSWMPTSADTAHLNRPGYTTLINDGTSAVASVLSVGFWGDHTLDVTGGALDVGNLLQIGAGTDDNGIMNVSGGAITVSGSFAVGSQDPYQNGSYGFGNGTLNMSGGMVIVYDALEVGFYDGNGDVDLSGGVIIASSLDMTANGSLMVSGDGLLVLLGNQLALVDGYIASGWVSGAAEFMTTGEFAGNTVVTVPEPTTLLLLGMGGLALFRRKR